MKFSTYNCLPILIINFEHISWNILIEFFKFISIIISWKFDTLKMNIIFCKSSLGEFFQYILWEPHWIAYLKHVSSLSLMLIHAFFNDIHFGKLIYLPALVELYLFYIIWNSFTSIAINPDW